MRKISVDSDSTVLILNKNKEKETPFNYQKLVSSMVKDLARVLRENRQKAPKVNLDVRLPKITIPKPEKINYRLVFDRLKKTLPKQIAPKVIVKRTQSKVNYDKLSKLMAGQIQVLVKTINKKSKANLDTNKLIAELRKMMPKADAMG